MVTNFTEEYQHISKGASIAFLVETQEKRDVITVTDESGAAFEPAHLVDVNLALKKENQEKLRALLQR